MSDPFVHDAGPYVLGALDEAEREAYEEHLAGCASCRAAVAELGGLPQMLARVPAEGPGDPPPTVLAGVLAEVERSRTRARRAWTVLGLAAAVVLGVAVSGSLVPLPWDPPAAPAAGTTLELVGDAPVDATVALSAVPWGTRVEVRCAWEAGGGGYASDVEYTLVVHDAEGRTQSAATWVAGPGDDVTVPGATSFRAEDIVRVEMVAGDAVVLAADV